jgi:hypothetical protein
MLKAGPAIVIEVSMVGLSACQTLSEPESFPTQRALVGMEEKDILACAGPPLRRVTQGEETVLLYGQRANTLDRAFDGSKRSVSDIRHGCEADITAQAGKVTDMRYRPFLQKAAGPRSSRGHCSPAYAGSHGCPSSAVVCYGGWIKPWRNVQRVSSDPSARAYGRRAEALAKVDMLRRVTPKKQVGPRL